jgi:uncharacterized protein YaeQ
MTTIIKHDSVDYFDAYKNIKIYYLASQKYNRIAAIVDCTFCSTLLLLVTRAIWITADSAPV